MPPPPDSPFSLVKYDAPSGKLAAYITKDPGDGKKHPAIVWLTGGDTISIGDVWSPMPPGNDQSAAAYRKASVVMMFPSQRGGNDNPGRREGFLGEVEDVLAATDDLVTRSYVDPERVYLGGHSTGATLAMLVAETSSRYRATFAFGPVEDPRGYGGAFAYYDSSNPEEVLLRAPIHWLDSIESPVFVFEGADGSSNIESLMALAWANENPKVKLFGLRRTDHFGILSPINELLAERIIADDGPQTNIGLEFDELQKLF